MNLKEKLKEAKTSATSSFNYIHLRAISNKEKTIIKVLNKDNDGIYIKFKNPHRLTIFEASFLYVLYIKNKIVRDYARYLDCPAGKKLEENIEEIRVITEDLKEFLFLKKFLKHLEKAGFYNCSPEDKRIIYKFLKGV